jgi:hypothetical protein
MPAQTHAVLLADVVESSSRAGLRALLASRLTDASRRHLRRKLIALPYSVTAGDEFQTVTRNLRALPEILLDLRTSFRPLSLRIGIGLGRVNDRLQPPVNRLGGEAFQSARKALEHLKTGNLFRFDTLTAFSSRDSRFDAALNLLYGLHDTLVLKITKKQWEAIAASREQRTLQRVARRLRLDASTVSRNLKRGYYWQLLETVKIAASLIESRFS